MLENRHPGQSLQEETPLSKTFAQNLATRTCTANHSNTHIAAKSGTNPISRLTSLSSRLLGITLPLLLILLSTGCSEKTTTGISLGEQHIQDQNFTLDNSKGGVINGQNGAIFAIPANAFLDSMGNAVSGEIQFTLKEANDDRSIVEGNLITRTGNDMLATDGMYFIGASQNGKPLTLNPEVGIYASLPNTAEQPGMGLYEGKQAQKKLDWHLTGQEQEELADCGATIKSQKKCKKCKKVLKLAKKIKPGKKPPKSDYWAKRYYWEKGVLYFAASGSRSPILSQQQLDDCRQYLESVEAGRELLGMVDQIKEEQKAQIGSYYNYRLQSLGWYNIDRLVKQELITFKGKLFDEDGDAAANASVHLYSKDPKLRVHIMTRTAEDGSFSMKFVPKQAFSLYCFKANKVTSRNVTLNYPDQDLGGISMQVLEEEELGNFLDELM